MSEVVHQLYAAFEARDWAAAGAVLAPEVVYELPQSRERVRGRENYLRFNRDYPGEWHLTLDRTVTEGRQVVAWLTVTVGADVVVNLAWITLDEAGLVHRIVDFWPEPADPLPGRPDYVERS